MPSIQGNPRSFHKRFKFIVEIDSFNRTGFNKCSELSAEVAKVEYYEGGALIPNKSPGRMTFTDVTLQRGASQDFEMFQWFKEVANAASGRGLNDNVYKRDVDIVQLDRNDDELCRWALSKAWPTKFVAGDWDADADEVNIRQLTLTHDYFDKV